MGQGMGQGNDLDKVYDTNFGMVRVYVRPGQPVLADWTVAVPPSPAGPDAGTVLGYITDSREKAVMSGVPSTFNPVDDEDEDPPRPFECADARGRFLDLAYCSVRGAATAIAGNAGLRDY